MVKMCVGPDSEGVERKHRKTYKKTKIAPARFSGFPEFTKYKHHTF
jgi:hypothetical protein